MGEPLDRLEAPTAELLVDVRTPAELAISPNGSSVAFSLHATVADTGSFVPSDLYVVESAAGATQPIRLTSGAWSDMAPGWSPADGGEPALAAELVGSAESVAWSSDARRLLVLAADPGSYGLDWSARAVNGATPAPDPLVRRPGDARRRLFLIDLASSDVG